MTRENKLIEKILRGASDASIGFDELRSLLERLGFVLRVRGSHHLFSKPRVKERINIQRDGANAKPYQVRQIRAIIVKHRLGGK